MSSGSNVRAFMYLSRCFLLLRSVSSVEEVAVSERQLRFDNNVSASFGLRCIASARGNVIDIRAFIAVGLQGSSPKSSHDCGE